MFTVEAEERLPTPARYSLFHAVRNCLLKSTTFLFMLASLCAPFELPARAHAGSPATTINLAGVPAPYWFSKFCRPSDGDMWGVGGRSQITHETRHEDHEFRPVKEDLSGVFFNERGVGFAVGSKGLILYTGDAGINWTRQVSGVGADLNAVRCVGDGRCWVVGDAGVALHSADGGQNWDKLETKTTAAFYALDFADDQHGWIVGEDGVVLYTGDGGQTWENRNVKIVMFEGGAGEAVADLHAVRFVNESLGWVAGAAGIARTADGGKSWKIIKLDESVIGIVSHDGKRAWAVTDSYSGKNFCSNDSGLTWQKCTASPKAR